MPHKVILDSRDKALAECAIRMTLELLECVQKVKGSFSFPVTADGEREIVAAVIKKLGEVST